MVIRKTGMAGSWKNVINRAPPRLPRPWSAILTFLRPPVPWMRSPMEGDAATMSTMPALWRASSRCSARRR